ncbi:DgyrCDS2189 [Dimorphilus gyrociliatus]|uniref:Cysteine-rich DPF motif domain-containing protein 1 n=1 Tax=Dimorphilus gyrociliatus TaxID=2664684 RepID=A0A7I8VCA9_9ANNE|nr:DgyrCDS2189 [Dimorphilus gyrociliatus]
MAESTFKNEPTVEEKKKDEEKFIREVFKCDKCSFQAPYDYYGMKPPFCKSLNLKEDSFIMRDPFTEGRKMVVIGAKCVGCDKNVCKSSVNYII